MALEQYVPPKLVIVEKEVYEIPFMLTVAGAAQLGYSSLRIPFPYKIIEIKMYFPDDAIGNVDVYWLTSNNDVVSAIAISAGTNPLLYLTLIPYFAGHADMIPLRLNITPLDVERYIKMHVVNGNAYATNMMSTVRIRRL